MRDSAHLILLDPTVSRDLPVNTGLTPDQSVSKLDIESLLSINGLHAYETSPHVQYFFNPPPPICLFLPSDNVFEGREEAPSQGPKKGARSLFVGHTSTSFSEDTEDLDSMLHRVCRDGGAYGGEETIRHDGAGVVLLFVGPSSPV